jgi:hypothetical protein
VAEPVCAMALGVQSFNVQSSGMAFQPLPGPSPRAGRPRMGWDLALQPPALEQRYWEERALRGTASMDALFAGTEQALLAIFVAMFALKDSDSAIKQAYAHRDLLRPLAFFAVYVMFMVGCCCCCAGGCAGGCALRLAGGSGWPAAPGWPQHRCAEGTAGG